MDKIYINRTRHIVEYFIYSTDGNPMYHNPDGPAVIQSDGLERWYMYGLKHRTDGPAIHASNRFSEWYLCGNLHREDGPASINAYGTMSWYKHGTIHREDGPAYISPIENISEWWVNGKLHRIDGPAISKNNNYFWYINGENITNAVNNWLVENNITYPFTYDKLFEFKLRFAG